MQTLELQDASDLIRESVCIGSIFDKGRGLIVILGIDATGSEFVLVTDEVSQKVMLEVLDRL